MGKNKRHPRPVAEANTSANDGKVEAIEVTPEAIIAQAESTNAKAVDNDFARIARLVEAAKILGLDTNEAKGMLEKVLATDQKVKAKAEGEQIAIALRAAADEIAKAVAAVLEEKGIELGKRKLVITQGEGKLEVELRLGSVKGTGASGRTAPPQHGKVTYFLTDGRQQEHKSCNALALSLGLQVQGRRNMQDVFEHDKGYTYRVVEGRVQIHQK